SVVEVKNVELPTNMQRAIARQAEAERERRAKIIAADGELQAPEKLAPARHPIATQPTTPQLRHLPTMNQISAHGPTTTTLPPPPDALRGPVGRAGARAPAPGRPRPAGPGPGGPAPAAAGRAVSVSARPASDGELAAVYDLRYRVFCLEQGVPEDLERDEQDDGALHLVAVDGGAVIGTCRLVRGEESWCLGRMAGGGGARRGGGGRARPVP